MFLDRPEVLRPGHRYHLLAGEEARSILEAYGFTSNIIRVPSLSWDMSVDAGTYTGKCPLTHLPGTAFGGEWRVDAIVPSDSDAIRDCFTVSSLEAESVVVAGTPSWYRPSCPRGSPGGGDGGVLENPAFSTPCDVESARKHLKGLRVRVDGSVGRADTWIVEAIGAEHGYSGVDLVLELPQPDRPSELLDSMAGLAAKHGHRIVILTGRDGGDPSLVGSSWSYGARFYAGILAVSSEFVGVKRQAWVDSREWRLWPPGWGGWSWAPGIVHGRISPYTRKLLFPQVDLAQAARESGSPLAALLYHRMGRLGMEGLAEMWRRHGKPVIAVRGNKVVWDGYVLAPELYGYGLVRSGIADAVIDLATGEVLYYRRPRDPSLVLEYRHARLVYRVQRTLEELGS